jgi:hypothetical protein
MVGCEVMRKFRGLTKDGKWVYGWYAETEGKSYIICEHKDQSIKAAAYGPFYFVYIQVIPKTVGQQVGLKAKTGKEIYFDDTLKDDNGIEYTVVWIEISARFNLIMREYPYTQFSGEAIPKLSHTGNIHQNPKLIEEAK